MLLRYLAIQERIKVRPILLTIMFTHWEGVPYFNLPESLSTWKITAVSVPGLFKRQVDTLAAAIFGFVRHFGVRTLSF
jgi:hypothetical protein